MKDSSMDVIKVKVKVVFHKVPIFYLLSLTVGSGTPQALYPNECSTNIYHYFKLCTHAVGNYTAKNETYWLSGCIKRC